MTPSTSEAAPAPELADPEEREQTGDAGAVVRLVVTDPAPGAWNMAVDAALADAVRAGGPPVLRFYRWEPACLSLGRNQPARGHYDEETLHQEGVEVVRRPTGGRAVLHDRELTYSFIAPVRQFGPPRTVYRQVNRALVRGLRALGAQVELAGESGRRVPVPSLAPCFAEPVPGEVVAGGRKLVGSAQVVERGVLLQHGSLPLDGDTDRIARLLPYGTRPSAARLADLLPTLPSWETLVEALGAAWRTELALDLQPAATPPDVLAKFCEHHARFADPAWTWQR